MNISELAMVVLLTSHQNTLRVDPGNTRQPGIESDTNFCFCVAAVEESQGESSLPGQMLVRSCSEELSRSEPITRCYN